MVKKIKKKNKNVNPLHDSLPDEFNAVLVSHLWKVIAMLVWNNWKKKLILGGSTSAVINLGKLFDLNSLTILAEVCDSH